jgi:GntR family transcriptional regulator/MocR family aminotransferase
VGSFSKTMLPTLRLGFLVAPRSIRSAVHKAKYVTDWHTPTLVQAAFVRFLESGGYARHIRRLSAVYRGRHEMIASAVTRLFADQLELVPSSTGLHLAARARHASASQIAAIARRAADADVAVQALTSSPASQGAQAGIVLGYGAITTRDVPEGLRRLRQCFRA